MSEERDATAGSPVEQAEATDTQVLAAVERAAEVVAPDSATTGADATNAQPAGERPVIAATTEPPSAGRVETAEEIFASHTSLSAGAQPTSVLSGEDTESDEPDWVNGAVQTGGTPVIGEAEAVAAPVVPVAVAAPERDGEIRINADHPMAALYMQSPMPPEVRGNRGAGVLIALLGTLAFAVVYVGVLALWLAPNYPPSTFLNQGLLPWVLNWGAAAAAAGFFIGLTLLVLIVGRAGWWAYVLGGFLVAAFTWAVALAGFALDARLGGASVSLDPYSLVVDFGLFFPVIAAGLVAREATVWFGAWIGSRGRKMKRLNADAIAEYEAALSEVQAQKP